MCVTEKQDVFFEILKKILKSLETTGHSAFLVLKYKHI